MFSEDSSDLLMPIGFALAFVLVGWAYGRSITGARHLTPFMRKSLVYGFFFVLGMCYVFLIGGNLHWPDSLMFSLIGLLAVLLACVAWWRYRRAHRDSTSLQPAQSLLVQLMEALPTVGLLVCLIGSVVEWEFVIKGEGHVLVGLLWTAGAAGTILLARQNRRATVVVALRAFAGLMLIGAFAQQSAIALVVSAAVVLALLLLERLWTLDQPGIGLNLRG